MAHMEKYKSSQLRGLIKEWARTAREYKNEKIDPTRTHLDYFIGCPQEEIEKKVNDRIAAIKSQTEKETGKALRKDTNALVSIVVTAPRNLIKGNLNKEDELTFFDAAYDWAVEQCGEENVMAGCVHYDETSPHIHLLITPVAEGRFAASKLYGREFLRQMHPSLSDFIERRLGYPVAILLSEEDKLNNALSSVPHDQLDAAKKAAEAEISKATAAKAAELADIEDQLEEATNTLRAITAAGEKAWDTAQEIAGSIDEMRKEKGRLDGELATKRAAIKQIDALYTRLQTTITNLQERLSEIAKLFGELFTFPRTFGEHCRELAADGSTVAKTLVDEGLDYDQPSERQTARIENRLDQEERSTRLLLRQAGQLSRESENSIDRYSTIKRKNTTVGR